MSKTFFSQIDEARVVAAIHDAESRSRGEIRIHITEDTVDDAVKEATSVFERLGMTATAERNGILIFVAPTSRKFAVLGDSGITSRAGTAVIDAMAASMADAFRASQFTEGLVTVVRRAGDLLAEHFPRAAGSSDQDELSNEISRG